MLLPCAVHQAFATEGAAKAEALANTHDECISAFELRNATQHGDCLTQKRKNKVFTDGILEVTPGDTCTLYDSVRNGLMRHVPLFFFPHYQHCLPLRIPASACDLHLRQPSARRAR